MEAFRHNTGRNWLPREEDVVSEGIIEPKTTRPEDVYYMHTSPSPPLRALIVTVFRILQLL